MLFRKRKNILIYLALIFGAFGLASGQNACKYINYMENSQTSAYKPKNNVKRAFEMPSYATYSVYDEDISYINEYNIYTNSNSIFIDAFSANDGSSITNGSINLAFNQNYHYYKLVIYNTDLALMYDFYTYNNAFVLVSSSINNFISPIEYCFATIQSFNNSDVYSIEYEEELMTQTQINSYFTNNNFNQFNKSQVYINYESRITAYQLQASSLNNQISSLNNQISSLNASIEILQNQLETTEDERDSLRIERDSLEIQKQTLETQKAQLETQKAQLETQVRNLQSQLAQNLPNNIIDWCKIFARGFVDIFNIEMLPNFKVGYLIVAPLLIGIISLFFKLIRGA